MAFKPSAAKKNKKGAEPTLNMNSMMDMLTIMMLFLLQSFNTEGTLATKADGLKPPHIFASHKPKKAVAINVSQAHIFFNKASIVEIDKVLAQKNSYVIPELAEKLEEEATRAQDLETRFGIEWKKELVIVADEKIPFNVLLKVVVTCGRNQFSNIRMLGNLAGKFEIM
jgi:biopolymer transport protein ExbD